MTVAAEPDPQTPEATPPLHERLERLVPDDFFDSPASAVEPATVAAPTDGTPESQPSAEAKPDETPAAETWVAPTADQLKDKAWWGALSKEGWTRAEKDHPVEAHHVKAAQAAATRIVNEAQAEAQRIREATPAPPATAERSTEPSDDEPSEELIALAEQLDSMDPKERAKALLKVVRASAPVVAKEIGVDPARNRADAVLHAAMVEAISTAEKLPEAQRFDLGAMIRNDADRAQLDKIADDSPELAALLATGTKANIAIALTAAGKVLHAQKQTAAADAKRTQDAATAEVKKKELQKTIQGNARPATAAIVQPHGATPAGKVPIRQRLEKIADEWPK